MVFHVLDRVFGNNGKPEKLFADSRLPQLIEEGFSEEEAKNLAWFYSRQTHGKVVGTLGGIATIYFLDPYYKSLVKSFPRLYYQPWIGTFLKLSVVYLGLQLGDYWSTCRREGANMWISHLYNNNYYVKSKDAFVRNFETLNRKFTDEEIEKFHLSKGTREDFKRKWIYNPALHGDEAAFNEKVEHIRNDKRAPYDKSEVKEKILVENQEKVKAGESLRLSPYQIVKDVDPTGRKSGLDINPLLHHYKALN